jgi:hypothetical protein
LQESVSSGRLLLSHAVEGGLEVEVVQKDLG